MKIEIDVPDWAAQTRIVILAGSECIAQKLPQEDFWSVKERRCNRCGECCLDSPPTPYGLDDEGKCTKLKKVGKEWICSAGLDKTLRCVLDPYFVNYKACNITHKRIKI